MLWSYKMNPCLVFRYVGHNVGYIIETALQTKNPDIFPAYSKRLEYAGNMSQLANSTLEVG